MTAIHMLLAERRPTISPTSRGPVVNLVAWIVMVTMCLAVLTVLGSRSIMARKLGWSDLLITTAMLFSVGQTVAISEQVANGLGRPLDQLSSSEYIVFQKAGYAASLLYIAALFCAKASTLSLLIALTPIDKHRKAISATGVLITLWAVAAVLGSAFQCSLPYPWKITTGNCFNQTLFWDIIGAFDIVSDILIMALPVFIVHKLQLPLSKKAAITFAFSFRIFAIGSTIFRLVELHRTSPISGSISKDVTLHPWVFTIATLLEVFFSIFATCIPHLRPFMESIQAGGYLSGAIHDASDRAMNSSSYLIAKSGPKSQRPSESHSRHQSQHSRNTSLGLTRVPSIGSAPTTHDVTVTASGPSGESRRPPRPSLIGMGEGDGGSYQSTRSVAMVIQQTQEWSVSYEHEH